MNSAFLFKVKSAKSQYIYHRLEIHLENMLKLSRMGATILPANPGFYQQPKTIDDLVDFIVARILDHLGIEHHLVKAWGQ